ncbi:hypothetical protein B0H16DRAFT_1450856 [Mycena metata]|uniref:Uncharacterized protein n=1 Tax=Mycena metata TaxID=1033252 RepID=A0AAD7K048_9AGAR|nr:hypothetical protein B0H16DRAFT_1450856 [Mycena metata]
MFRRAEPGKQHPVLTQGPSREFTCLADKAKVLNPGSVGGRPLADHAHGMSVESDAQKEFDNLDLRNNGSIKTIWDSNTEDDRAFHNLHVRWSSTEKPKFAEIRREIHAAGGAGSTVLDRVPSEILCEFFSSSLPHPRKFEGLLHTQSFFTFQLEDATRNIIFLCGKWYSLREKQRFAVGSSRIRIIGVPWAAHTGQMVLSSCTETYRGVIIGNTGVDLAIPLRAENRTRVEWVQSNWR